MRYSLNISPSTVAGLSGDDCTTRSSCEQVQKLFNLPGVDCSKFPESCTDCWTRGECQDAQKKMPILDLGCEKYPVSCNEPTTTPTKPKPKPKPKSPTSTSTPIVVAQQAFDRSRDWLADNWPYAAVGAAAAIGGTVYL